MGRMEVWPEKLGLRAGPSMEQRAVVQAEWKVVMLCQGRLAVELALSVVSEQRALAEGVSEEKMRTEAGLRLKVGKPLEENQALEKGEWVVPSRVYCFHGK